MHAGLLSIISASSWQFEEIPGDCKKANITHLPERQEGESRELQACQPHVSP